MSNDTKVLDNTSFLVISENQLTEYDRRVLTYLYMPIVGALPINLYTVLYTFINNGDSESALIPHLKLSKMLQILDMESILEARHKLEAMGLLKVYNHDNRFVYLLKRVMTPSAFLSDDLLRELLINAIGPEEMQKTACDFLAHSIDLSKYRDITKAFDEVYEYHTPDGNNQLYFDEIKTIILNDEGERVVVQNPHFDYKYFSTLIGAFDIIKPAVLNGKTLYDFANRYSFIYQLTSEEIKDALVASLTIEGEINYEEFKKQIKRIYDGRGKKPILTTIPQTSQSNDKIIRMFEQTAPTKIVETITNESLTGSEIEMFEQLRQDNNINLGILNVLICYVIKQKGGEIPSYNYFNKIIKTWKRVGVKTTKDAFDYTNGRFVTTVKTYTPNKRGVKDVPDWYDDYLKETKARTESTNQTIEDQKTIAELQAFFDQVKEVK